MAIINLNSEHEAKKLNNPKTKTTKLAKPTISEFGQIVRVSGPLIVARDVPHAKMFDVVRIGQAELLGEIIEIRKDLASIQVYEDTCGLKVGDIVTNTFLPLYVESAPGIIGSIYDGIQRPLDSLYKLNGARITRSAHLPAINRDKRWEFIPVAKIGDIVAPGDILGIVHENEMIDHKILSPHGLGGKIIKIERGSFCVTDTIALVDTKFAPTSIKKSYYSFTNIDDKGIAHVTMLKRWPVRQGRHYAKKLKPCEPLITGQRVIDTFFPIAKGGTSAIPGPFGSGKTVVQHQLAKWSNADIVVYIGCGERGNEMTDVLKEFPTLTFMQTGQPLMKRTILVANTSDMPVAAREASIYTGITIAEYFRDMGYNVAVMADSTSRWAEALREMSGRLEEMPGEEGYPAYLSSRFAEFYERAGIVETLGNDKRIGSITIIGAVSPPGGDLSEPVAQTTLRIVETFWGLSSALAYRRHLPAIDWLTSYSLYAQSLKPWYDTNLSPDFLKYRAKLLKILLDESELEQIARLIGIDALSARDRIILETAKIIREDFLNQNAYNSDDTYTSLQKQYKMICAISAFYDKALQIIEDGAPLAEALNPQKRAQLSRIKYVPDTELDKIDALIAQLKY